MKLLIEVGVRAKFTKGPYKSLHFEIVHKYDTTRQVAVRLYNGAEVDIDAIDLVQWTVADAS